MSLPYDPNMFRCDVCGKSFYIQDIIYEDDCTYCKACYDKMLAKEGENDA